MVGLRRWLQHDGWWLTTLVGGALLVVHTVWPARVDATSLAILAIVALSPFLPSLRRIRIGDFEAEMDLAEIRRLRDRIQEPERVNATSPSSATERAREAESLRDLSRRDPELALAKLRIDLERVLRELYARSMEQPLERSPGAVPSLVRHLTASAILDADTAAAIREITKICNRAVHGEPISQKDAAAVIDVGQSVLAQIKAAIGAYLPSPQRFSIALDEVEKAREAAYRVTTIIPYAKEPIRNVYLMSQDDLDRFLQHYNEYAEFIIEVASIDGVANGVPGS